MGKKLKQPMAPRVPGFRPFQVAPKLWAQSSTTCRPWRPGQPQEPVHVAGAAEEVHRYDGPGPGGDGPLHEVRVQVQAVLRRCPRTPAWRPPG